MITEGNEKNFNELIKEGTVIVDFYAEWCGPCKMLGPVLKDLVSTNSSIKVVKIDVDSNSNLAAKFGVMSIPTLLLYKNNNLINKKMGFMTKEMLLEWIN